MPDQLPIHQLVAFCILMQNGEGIMSKAPDYIREKFKAVQLRETFAGVRALLDDDNQRIFDAYFSVVDPSTKRT